MTKRTQSILNPSNSYSNNCTIYRALLQSHLEFVVALKSCNVLLKSSVLVSKTLKLCSHVIQPVELTHFPDLVTHHALLVHPTPTPSQDQHHVTAMPTTTRPLMEPASLVHLNHSHRMAQKSVLVCLAITEPVENLCLSHAQVSINNIRQ